MRRLREVWAWLVGSRSIAFNDPDRPQVVKALTKLGVPSSRVRPDPPRWTIKPMTLDQWIEKWC